MTDRDDPSLRQILCLLVKHRSFLDIGPISRIRQLSRWCLRGVQVLSALVHLGGRQNAAGQLLVKAGGNREPGKKAQRLSIHREFRQREVGNNVTQRRSNNSPTSVLGTPQGQQCTTRQGAEGDLYGWAAATMVPAFRRTPCPLMLTAPCRLSARPSK